MKAPISSKYVHSETQVLLIAQYRLLNLRSVGSGNTPELNTWQMIEKKIWIIID